jgi:hypothetical protein
MRPPGSLRTTIKNSKTKKPVPHLRDWSFVNNEQQEKILTDTAFFQLLKY